MRKKYTSYFKSSIVISGIFTCLLFISSCGKLARYEMNSNKIGLDSFKNQIKTGYIPIKNLGSGTFLHFAALSGNIEEVKSLLKNGDIDVDVQNIYESSPLHYASENGHVKVVKELLNNGANVNAKNIARWTPLHYASKNGHLEVVKELLNNGANINEKINMKVLHFI